MAAREKRSKRPSVASSGSKPPEALIFFIDRSLGKKIVAQALRDSGETVEIHDDHFLPDAKDEDWLVEVGSRGWIVLTKDDRIRYRVTERTAIMSASESLRADVQPTSRDRNGCRFSQSASTNQTACRRPCAAVHRSGFKEGKSVAVVKRLADGREIEDTHTNSINGQPSRSATRRIPRVQK